MKDWNIVKHNKELLKQVEKLVDMAAEYYYDDFPDEICEQLNELTGNNWESKAYVDRCCEYWESPWHLKQVVFALFHDGVMPEINDFRLNIVKTSETIDLPGLEIRHALCTGKYGDEFRNKFEDLPQKEITDWFTNTFSGWNIEHKEEPDKVTKDGIEYGETTYLFTCNDDQEYPLDKRVGVSVSNDRTAFVWGEDLSDEEKNNIKNFFASIGCRFID